MIFMLGVVAGVGVLFIVVGLRRRPAQYVLSPGLDDQAAPRRRFGEITNLKALLKNTSDRVESSLSSNTLLIQDALMVGRPIETHALIKMAGLGIGAVLVGLFMLSLLAFTQLELPPFVVGFASLVGALLGWVLPDSILRTEAAKEREHFEEVAAAWLELVAQLVTAGTDTLAALGKAASYSDQPGFQIIRDALRVSALSGEPPWTGLRRLSAERRLLFLDPFCAALELAGTTGAGAREAILSQVDAGRSKAMLEADAAAGSASEKMGAPLALIGGAFMTLMGYPPMAGIMDTATLSGL